jgi:predicted acylesterase/phospholipase RssA
VILGDTDSTTYIERKMDKPDPKTKEEYGSRLPKRDFDKFRKYLGPIADNSKFGLSLSGGGMRGVLTIQMILEIITEFYGGYNPSTHKQFLLSFSKLSGSSIGSLLCVCLIMGFDLNLIKELFINWGDVIFNRNNFTILMKTLFGSATMGELRFPIVVPTFNCSSSEVEFFSEKTRHVRIYDVLLASTAAPYYFDPYTFNPAGSSKTYSDGGLIMNKPIDDSCMWMMIGSGVNTKSTNLTFSYLKLGRFMENLANAMISSNEQLTKSRESVVVIIDYNTERASITMTGTEMRESIADITYERLMIIEKTNIKLKNILINIEQVIEPSNRRPMKSSQNQITISDEKT